MDQVHKRFTAEQVRVLIKGYCQGTLDRSAIQETLGIGKTRFFALLRQYRWGRDEFSLTYQRTTPPRLPASAEKQIEAELMLEKGLIEDPSLPISNYNYAAIKDRLAKHGVIVSSPTIIARAKGLGCYQPHPRKKAHDREVLTTAIGALIQHDASLHKWSPYANEKWALITSLDDFSRKILYADFVEQETTWAHIKAAESVMLAYGIPLRYYVDSLRVFRFVQGRDSVWRKHVLQTDEADPQWRQVMRSLGVDVSYALSPAAKRENRKTLSLATGPHCQDLRYREDKRNRRCPSRLKSRAGPLQQPPGSLHYWRGPQHPLCEGQKRGEQPV